MTVHVSGCSISALLLPSVSLLGLPADALAQSVVAPQRAAPTLAERHASLLFGDWRKYYDTVRVVRAGELGGRKVYRESTEIGGRMIFQVERVEVGVELAPDTFTLQPSTESGRGK